MPVYLWSQTAANNGVADPTCPVPEGMAASALNDSARGSMAAIAQYRDDIAGSIVTAGTNVAYKLSSNSGYTELAQLNGKIIAFSPHTTNGVGPVTLTVDGLGSFPLQPSPGVTLQAGVLIEGTPYVAIFNSTAGAFYLRGNYGNPYNVPLGAGFDYWMPTAPNSSFAFPAGQAISRITYATLFAGMGTTYGPGDGATTFNLPDKTGRVSAMQESSATRLTSSYFGGNSTVLGAMGGLESETLTTAQIPAHTHGNTLSDPEHTHSGSVGSQGTGQTGAGGQPGLGSNNTGVVAGTITINSNTTGITINNASQGGGGAHNNVQPTIICNYILRII